MKRRYLGDVPVVDAGGVVSEADLLAVDIG
jgi:hypothetical protein